MALDRSREPSAVSLATRFSNACGHSVYARLEFENSIRFIRDVLSNKSGKLLHQRTHIATQSHADVPLPMILREIFFYGSAGARLRRSVFGLKVLRIISHSTSQGARTYRHVLPFKYPIASALQRRMPSN
jgi:hypothetical protein